MVYNKLVIPKQNPTAAASLISPAPTFLANNAGNEKIANPATNPNNEETNENCKHCCYFYDINF